ncbi:SPFH domain-containing protein [Frateuria sp. MAH-13]|uniref:SPFH domain-containing protein n=1 Tax=Frateuria flava TaxID=2821489 RepID=A0ABS4DI25_9GAMM|nr:SPFH domain-containing protein [Frateuria flava]MBP1472698.1 SPFH domain-containing protein [Frateuria flava]
MNERKGFSIAGIPFIGVCLVLAAIGVLLLVSADGAQPAPHVVPGMLLLAFTGFLLKGFFQVAPNEAQVMQLFGRYAGSVREEGLRWTNPFYAKHRLSLRVRNFESGKLKVNDNDGNPIEIAAVVVWQVIDTAEAVFRVEDYENFVHIQSESALRQMAQSYPYDAHDDGQPSLRSHGEVINNHLRDEIQARLEQAGVQVIEARISHLAYAQEIAQAMLQRQQAGAIIAARTRIVEGAVSMVEMALDQLSRRGVVELDEERKAAMVSNLLVVLCGERGTQAVVNTGTLYG